MLYERGTNCITTRSENGLTAGAGNVTSRLVKFSRIYAASKVQFRARLMLVHGRGRRSLRSFTSWTDSPRPTDGWGVAGDDNGEWRACRGEGRSGHGPV